jgi:pimeloyl-ACP methyl ester carboxylesterase
MEPKTGYALLDGQQIAYQVIGDGAVDIVMAPSWFSAIDLEWQEPRIRRFFERLGSFARVIRFDRRGSGASDPLANDALPPWEAFADDIRCVMDAVGSEHPFLYGDGDAGPLSVLFAATHPDLVRGLILFHTAARFLADADYEMGMPQGVADSLADGMTQDWGVANAEMVRMWVPSQADDVDFRQWIARLMRATTTPS